MLYNFLEDQSMQNRPAKILYRYIYQHGPVSRAELIDKTNLNRGKVSRLLKELLDKNYIQIIGQGESEGGRPPSLYQINSESSYIIGVQITRMETRIVLFDLQFNMLSQKTVTMTNEHTPEIVIDIIIKTISEFMKENRLTTSDLLGIGIGTIGPLDREKGIILHPELFLANDWTNVPIVQRIREKFPVLVLLENGANTAVLGEYKYNRSYKNILSVTVGWAWGIGIILNGELMQVDDGDSGGYGHMVINSEGKNCICGKKGCAVAYTSLHAIINDIKERSPELYNSKLKGLEHAPIDRFLKVILELDEHAEDVILNSAKYLGVGVSNLATLFHSEFVSLNGPLINHYPGYYEKLIEHISANMTTRKVEFSKGNFGGDSMVIGAAVLVFDSIVENI